MNPVQDYKTMRILKRLLHLNLHRITLYKHVLIQTHPLDQAIKALVKDKIAASETFVCELTEQLFALQAEPSVTPVAPDNSAGFSRLLTLTLQHNTLRLLVCKMLEGYLIKSYEKAFAAYSLSLPVRRLVLRHQRRLAEQVSSEMCI
jgi:hypothetical protein